MKKIIPTFLLFFATALYAQKNTENDTVLIKNLIIESFNQLWSNMDEKLIDKFYTKDFILLENGEIWNNDSISINFKKAKLREKIIPIRTNKIDFIDIKIGNGMAWVAYHNRGSWTHEKKVLGNAHWLESAIAIWTDNRWKVQMLHSTIIKEE